MKRVIMPFKTKLGNSNFSYLCQIMNCPDEKIWDPLRKKWLVRTPEEEVRQWFIQLLHRQLQIPLHMMMSEVHMQFGEGYMKKDYRADILVYDRNLHPLMVVECKRPDVHLAQEVVEQVLRYNMVMHAPYLAVTNGQSSYVCHLEDGKYVFQKKVPTYLEMIGNE